jgi:branched-chain amino acid transport system ATP-binding protein
VGVVDRLRPWTVPIVALAVALLYPVVFDPQDFRLVQLEYVAAMVVVALGLNVVLGYAGQLFLGPSAVFGIAAFTVGVAATHVPALGSFWLMLLVGVVAGIVAGVVLGAPALRLGGFYLAMLTLYVATVLPILAQRIEFLGGVGGISLIGDPDFTQTYGGTTLFQVTVLIVSVVALFCWLVRTSRLGRRFVLLATSEELTTSLGFSTYRAKLLAFVLGSAVIGVGGALYVHTQQFVSANSASPQLSILLLAACVVGGIGRVSGAIVGAALVFGFGVFVPSLEQYEGIAFGVLIILVMIVRPGGIVGFGRFAARRPALAPVDEVDVVLAPRPTHPAVLAPVPRATLTSTGLVRRFGKVVAVDSVDLHVQPGTVHGLVGPNGSGKTTALNVINGFLVPSAGMVQVGDHRLKRGRPTTAALAGVSRTFQTPKLVGHVTVVENLMMAADRVIPGSAAASILRLPAGRRHEQQARALAMAWLDRLSLATVADRVAAALPHGTQRLVEIGRAMLLGSSVVLLDEPAAGLSPAEIEVVKTAVRDMTAAGSSVLLVEHNLPIVYDLADEITVLDRGHILRTGSPEAIAHDAEVARIYVGGGPEDAATRRVAAPTTAGGSLLTIRGLRAGYGAMEVVGGIDLEVAEGELVAIVGRNGTGKTTALAAISGQRFGANAGEVVLEGRHLEHLPPWEVAEAGLALVPEGRRIFGQMTVTDNLRMAASIRRVDARDAAADLAWVRRLFPALERYANTMAGSLSGGEQQMVAVAQALVSRPRVLLLDEPTAGLAPVLVQDLYATLVRLRDEGVSLVVVDQNVERLLAVADRAFLMETGRLTLGGPVRDLSIPDLVDSIVRGGSASLTLQESP